MDIEDNQEHIDPRFVEVAREIKAKQTSLGRSTRNDADVSTYNLARALVHTTKEVFRQEHADLQAMDFLVAPAERASIGKTQFTWVEEEIRGEVLVTRTMVQDSPTSDVGREEQPMQYFAWLQTKYGWTMGDMWAWEESGGKLPQARAEAAKTNIAHRHDDILLIADGSEKYGKCRGLFNLTGTLTFSPLAGVAGTAWKDKTGDEVFRDMWRAFAYGRAQTNFKELPNTTIIPESAFDIASELRMGDANQSSPIQHFLDRVRKRVPDYEVMSANKLEAGQIPGVTNGRMVTYHRGSNRHVYRNDIVEFDQFAPVVSGTGVEVQCFGKTGGAVAPRKKSICYTDGVTVAA